ncbi:MAG TPA: peptide-methionine (R)-S-oxide reductase MsrB [Hyphomicrobium sp.]|nr:peptide-methionine (R)-S-oxide reductase MsrB [Hyphomicrobium sp.]
MLTRRAFTLSSFAVAAAGWPIASLRADEEAVSISDPKSEYEIEHTPEEWHRILTPEQFNVLREHGTERAGSSPLDKNYAAGTYLCAGCELPLFSSETKFNSGTGWPSFYRPLPNAVGDSADKSYFMTRTEIHCRRCGGHLGHVFKDGPPPTGLRFCMNGVALKFVPADVG